MTATTTANHPNARPYDDLGEFEVVTCVECGREMFDVDPAWRGCEAQLKATPVCDGCWDDHLVDCDECWEVHT